MFETNKETNKENSTVTTATTVFHPKVKEDTLWEQVKKGEQMGTEKNEKTTPKSLLIETQEKHDAPTPVKYKDPKESVCFDELFSGESSKDVVKEIKEKCDQGGIMGKLDGSNTGAATMLAELVSQSTATSRMHSMQSFMEKAQSDDIPEWFKSLVMKGATKQMTERASCLGMLLMPSDIQAAEDTISCLDTEFGEHSGGIQQPMSKQECDGVVDVVNSVVKQRFVVPHPCCPCSCALCFLFSVFFFLFSFFSYFFRLLIYSHRFFLFTIQSAPYGRCCWPQRPW
jgi:hypothetical protein